MGLPAVPFLFLAKPVALAVMGMLMLTAPVVIAQFRVPAHGALGAYLQTFGILIAAAGLSIGATPLFNLAG